MFEESVGGNEPVLIDLRPEIVGGEHSDRRQHTEASGPQPYPSSNNHQRGAAEFDHDGRSGPEPSWLQAKMRLLSDSRGEVDKFLDPAYHEGRDQRSSRDRQGPRERKD